MLLLDFSWPVDKPRAMFCSQTERPLLFALQVLVLTGCQGTSSQPPPLTSRLEFGQGPGVVVHAQTAPGAGVVISAAEPGSSWPAQQRAQADAAGNASFRIPLPPGSTGRVRLSAAVGEGGEATMVVVDVGQPPRVTSTVPGIADCEGGVSCRVSVDAATRTFRVDAAAGARIIIDGQPHALTSARAELPLDAPRLLSRVPFSALTGGQAALQVPVRFETSAGQAAEGQLQLDQRILAMLLEATLRGAEQTPLQWPQPGSYAATVYVEPPLLWVVGTADKLGDVGFGVVARIAPRRRGCGTYVNARGDRATFERAMHDRALKLVDLRAGRTIREGVARAEDLPCPSSYRGGHLEVAEASSATVLEWARRPR